MFYRDKTINALNEKRAALTQLDQEQRLRLQEMYAARDALAGMTAADITRAAWPGESAGRAAHRRV